MLSRRYGLRSSKRSRIPGKRLGFWAPIRRPEAMTYARCSNAPTTITDIWIFLLGYYGSLSVIIFEFLILTIIVILQHTFLPLQLFRRSVLAPSIFEYFGNSKADENYDFRRWWSRMRFEFGLAVTQSLRSHSVITQLLRSCHYSVATQLTCNWYAITAYRTLPGVKNKGARPLGKKRQSVYNRGLSTRPEAEKPSLSPIVRGPHVKRHTDTTTTPDTANE